MAAYAGRTDKHPNHGEPHVADAIARDIEFGYFDSQLAALAKAVEERRRTVMTAAVVGSRVKG